MRGNTHGSFSEYKQEVPFKTGVDLRGLVFAARTLRSLTQDVMAGPAISHLNPGTRILHAPRKASIFRGFSLWADPQVAIAHRDLFPEEYAQVSNGPVAIPTQS